MDRTDARFDLARRLPKAELHLHLEGTLEPEMMFELARKNDVALEYPSVEAVRAAYEFSNLQEFLDVYYAGASVLVTARDFHDLTLAYLERVAADGVVHVEPFFDPQTHTARGVALGDVVEGIVSALEEGERIWGISWRLIMCFLRDLPAHDAMATLEAARPYAHVIHAVGLDSAEVGNPPEKFTEVFAAARAMGFDAVAHAGEEGTADDVRRTLDLLGVSRIDHGVRALDDSDLVARLVDERIALTVCPLSNVKLRVFDDLSAHNLVRMIELGIIATVNSDDPAYFGGYLLDNYAACIESLGLSEQHLRTLAANSIGASFLSEDDKARWLARIDAL